MTTAMDSPSLRGSGEDYLSHARRALWQKQQPLTREQENAARRAIAQHSTDAAQYAETAQMLGLDPRWDGVPPWRS